MRPALAVTLVLVLLVGLAEASAQVVLNVPGNYPTIQAAVTAALPGHTILVAPGLYNEDVDFMGKSLILVSTGGEQQTTIVGTGSGRVLDLSGTSAATFVSGFTITGGQGGILISGNASPVIGHCIVRNNHATGLEGGGGILIVAENGAVAMPIVQDCEIAWNTSDNGGGGIQIDVRDSTSATTLLFARSRVHDNVALGLNGPSTGCGIGGGPCATAGGGGVHVFARGNLPSNGMASLTMTECVVEANTTVQDGGGILLENAGAAVLRETRIHGNTAVYGVGGGIAAHNCPLVLRGCELSANGSTLAGGGLHLGASFPIVVTVETATIVDNQAPIGGGIRPDSSLLTLDLANSIVWGNSNFDLFTTNATVSTVHCDLGAGTPLTGPGNVNVDPLFVDRAGHDYHLSRNSPLVDAGDPFATGITLTDRDGTPRIENGIIDVGADEVPQATLPGSGEDLEMHSFRLGRGGDPNVSLLPLAVGDVLLLRLVSPGESLTGAPALIVGQAFTTGFPPASPPALPGIHLDGFGLQVIYGDPNGVFLFGPTVPSGGVLLGYLVPPGLAGQSFRLQGFAVTPLAQNGAYAVTEAHDLRFL